MNIGKILVIGGGVLVLGFWVVPQWEEHKLIKNEISALSTLKAQKTETVRSLQGEEKVQSEAILQSIPYSPEQAILIKDLRVISTKTGFAFRSLGFGKGQNPTVGATQTTVNFSVLGKKSQVPNFLNLIEKNKRFMGMNNLAISFQKKNEVDLAELNITLYAFSQQE